MHGCGEDHSLRSSVVTEIRDYVFEIVGLQISHSLREATLCVDILVRKAHDLDAAQLLWTRPCDFCRWQGAIDLNDAQRLNGHEHYR